MPVSFPKPRRCETSTMIAGEALPGGGSRCSLRAHFAPTEPTDRRGYVFQQLFQQHGVPAGLCHDPGMGAISKVSVPTGQCPRGLLCWQTCPSTRFHVTAKGVHAGVMDRLAATPAGARGWGRKRPVRQKTVIWFVYVPLPPFRLAPRNTCCPPPGEFTGKGARWPARRGAAPR